MLVVYCLLKEIKTLQQHLTGHDKNRDQTSLNGVVTVKSFDTGKVFDFECLSKFCVGCVVKSNMEDPKKKEEDKKYTVLVVLVAGWRLKEQKPSVTDLSLIHIWLVPF